MQNNTTQEGALVNSTTDTLKKSRLWDRTDRAWLVALYDIRPGNRAGLFLQLRRLHGAVQSETCETFSGAWEQFLLDAVCDVIFVNKGCK